MRNAAARYDELIKLDVISDPICPWCYIGKTHLDRALAMRPDHGFVIEWHPFQLNPTMPPEGMDRRAYLETKFGGPEGAARAYAPVVSTAQKAGLSINFDGIKTTPNTIDAHRLIHWGGVAGCQTAIVDQLFDAYFVKGQNIGDHGILANIAAACGMDRTEVAARLDSDHDLTATRARDSQIRKMGVSSVPTFVILNQHVVSGAQPPETWVSIIDQIAAQT